HLRDHLRVYLNARRVHVTRDVAQRGHYAVVVDDVAANENVTALDLRCEEARQFRVGKQIYLQRREDRTLIPLAFVRGAAIANGSLVTGHSLRFLARRGEHHSSKHGWKLGDDSRPGPSHPKGVVEHDARRTRVASFKTRQERFQIFLLFEANVV